MPKGRGGCWILAYHLVGAGTDLPVDLPEGLFREHLRLLKEQANVIPLRELLGRGSGHAAVGSSGGERERWPREDKPRVALTFDDGFANFSERALPLLAAFGLPATLFVPPGFLNGDGRHPFGSPQLAHLAALSWSGLFEAVQTGLVDVGSHTYSHRNMLTLSEAELRLEFGASLFELEQRLQRDVIAVCYPEGIVSRRILRMAGRFYPAGVRGGGFPARIDRDPPLALPRMSVRRDLSPEDLARLLPGACWLDEAARDRVRQIRGRVQARRGG